MRQRVEFVEGIVVDDDAAGVFSPAAGDRDAEPDCAGKSLTELLVAALERAGVDFGVFARALGGFGAAGGERLELADREVSAEGESGDGDLSVGREAENGAGVSHSESSVGEHFLDLFGQGEEAEVVGDAGAAFAEAGGEPIGDGVEKAQVVAVRDGAVDGIEVVALQVFDEGGLGGVGLGERTDDGGDGGECGESCRAESAFTGDELELAVVEGADEDGLEDAVGFDGIGQLGQAGFVEDGAWLAWVGGDVVEPDVEDGG